MANNPTSFIFIKRQAYTLEKDQSMINQFTKILMEQKQTKSLVDNGVNIAISPFIEMVASGSIDMAGKFEDITKTQGGLILVCVDLSGSMRNYPEIRKSLYNLTLAFERLDIQFEVIGFSCARHTEVSYIDVMKSSKEIERVHEDEKYYHDRMDLCLKHYVIPKIKAIKSDMKIGLFLISDGIPEGCREHRDINRQELIDLTRQQLTLIETLGVKPFSIFLGNNTDSRLIPMFRTRVFFTKRLNVGVEKLVKSMNQFLRSL